MPGRGKEKSQFLCPRGSESSLTASPQKPPHLLPPKQMLRWLSKTSCISAELRTLSVTLSGSFRTLAEMSPRWGIRGLSVHVPCRLSRGCTCHAHTGILNSGWNSPGTYPTLSSSLSGHFSCFSWNDLSLPQLPIFPASSLSLCPSRSSSDSASLRELSPHPHP